MTTMEAARPGGTGIAPIVQSVAVKAPPARAFAIFTGDMAAWWPRGKTIGAAPHAAIVIEPRAGGRWFERDAEGRETDWGRVIAWEPPGRLLLAWQIGGDLRHDPGLVTELELSFAARPGGGTQVTLEHRDLERMGADAARVAEALRGGWPGMIARFAERADAEG